MNQTDLLETNNHIDEIIAQTITQNYVSISWVQRKFGFGYLKAKHCIDTLINLKLIKKIKNGYKPTFKMR